MRAQDVAARLNTAYPASSSYALCPSDPELLLKVLQQHFSLVDTGVPKSTRAKEESAIRLYWEPMCRMLNTNPIRPSVAELSSSHLELEQYLLAFLIPYTYERMPSKRGVVGEADPMSAMRVVQSVNSFLGREYDARFSTHVARRVLTGLLTQHVQAHGPLLPERKLPFVTDMLIAILGLPTGTKLGAIVLDWDSVDHKALRACLETAAQSGIRLDEAAISAYENWTKAKMARGNLSYNINGKIVTNPTEAQLRSIRVGDFAILTPATSKCDRWGKKHGGKIIVLPYLPDHAWNGCRALVQMELADPVYGIEARRSTPLFRTSTGQALSTSRVRTLLHYMLNHKSVLDVTPQHTQGSYSFHSFRRFYATCLGQANASKLVIQSMVRWLSDEAVDIYNNTSVEDQIRYVKAAYQSRPHTLTPEVLASIANIQMDDDDMYVQCCNDFSVAIEPLLDF